MDKEVELPSLTVQQYNYLIKILELVEEADNAKNAVWFPVEDRTKVTRLRKTLENNNDNS